MRAETRGQMSDSMLNVAFLTLSGGLQDAYTYISRGGVFANAQTGNIVLLSSCSFEGNFGAALKYLTPLLFFALGVAASELIRRFNIKGGRLHWRQTVLLAETVLLFLVGFMPSETNALANAVVSFCCAMQVQAFRKVNGYSFASTMCIGNLRSGMDSLCAYLSSRKKEDISKAMHYFGVILLFAVGAGIGSRLVALCEMKAIWASCLLLSVSFALMFVGEEKE